MSTTIFCTFDQRDLADLAMGQIRQIPGVHSISYVVDNRENSHPYNGGGYNGGAYALGIFGAFGNANSIPDTPYNEPSRPTGIKIGCDDRVRQRVISKLVNLHAYRIVAAP